MNVEHSDPDLASLLERVANGESAGLAALYEHTSGQLFAVLVRMLGRRDLAEEALQDVFISIWRSAQNYRTERGSAMAWLVTISRNRAVDIRRRTGKESRLDQSFEEAPFELASTDPGPLAQTMQAREERDLKDCLGRLTDSQQRSIRLAYFDGFSHEQISSALSSPLGTVKSWVRRGLQALKQCLQELQGAA